MFLMIFVMFLCYLFTEKLDKKILTYFLAYFLSLVLKTYEKLLDFHSNS
jgi:hypothetical protein